MDILLQQSRPEYRPLLDLTAPFHLEYCKRHGLDYVRVDGASRETETLPGFWDSIPLFIEYTHKKGVEHVFWLDADTLIVSDEDIRWAHRDSLLTMARHPGPPEHYNCGVFFMDAVPAVTAFFREVMRHTPGEYPWYQQQVMNDLLLQPQWGWMIGQMDNRWNATVGVTDVPDPAIVAWHGTPGGVDGKLTAMLRYLATHDVAYM